MIYFIHRLLRNHKWKILKIERAMLNNYDIGFETLRGNYEIITLQCEFCGDVKTQIMK